MAPRFTRSALYDNNIIVKQPLTRAVWNIMPECGYYVEHEGEA